MFKQMTRSSLWIAAAVLSVSSALGAQVQGTAVQTTSNKPQSQDVTAGSVAFAGEDDALAKVAWIDLGYAFGGPDGVPKFKVSGKIAAGSRTKLILKDAAPMSMAVLFVSLGSAPHAFKGGMLVPAAPTLDIVLFTDATGYIELPISASANLPAGFDLFMQYAVLDATAPQGVALSNALQTSTH